MRSSLLHSPLLLAALALALGLAGAAQAADVHAPHAVSATAQDNQRDAPGDGAVRIDWNVDYPSQLGPEGPHSATDAQRNATVSAARGTASFARQPDAR